jgi:hypothetical protein
MLMDPVGGGSVELAELCAGAEVTGGPDGGVPFATAVFTTRPRSTSAWVVT